MPKADHHSKTQPRGDRGRFAKTTPSADWLKQPFFPEGWEEGAPDLTQTFKEATKTKVVVRTLTRDRIPLPYLGAWIAISVALCLASGVIASRYPII